MEPDELRRVVGNNIRRIAWKKGISLNRVADFAGIDRSGFFRAVAGKAAFTTDRLAKIALALEVAPAELLDERAAEVEAHEAQAAADAVVNNPDED